jgi:hypothetical protein
MKINWNKTTEIFLSVMLGVCLIYEVIVVVGSNDADSISWTIQTAAIRRPIVAGLAGILFGHFFWQDYKGSGT